MATSLLRGYRNGQEVASFFGSKTVTWLLKADTEIKREVINS